MIVQVLQITETILKLDIISFIKILFYSIFSVSVRFLVAGITELVARAYA
jgi:hypothetical protein